MAGVYRNRIYWELLSNPPMVLKTMANTSCANTPETNSIRQLNAMGYYPRKSCAVQFCWWEPGKKTNINGKKLQIDATKPE